MWGVQATPACEPQPHALTPSSGGLTTWASAHEYPITTCIQPQVVHSNPRSEQFEAIQIHFTEMAPRSSTHLQDKLEESPQVEHRIKKEPSHVDAIFDPQAEKKLLRKCDLHILPSLALIYFLSFMDRTNIGNF